MTVTPQLPEVSCCYADADALSLNELEKYLNLFKHEGLIGTFHKRQISPGTNWVEAFDHHINTASVILLLVSANFLASEYVSGREMQRALQRQDANEAYVIPILLQKVDWGSTPLGKLHSLPTYGRHIAHWSKRDEAFIAVAQGIREALEVVRLLMEDSPELPETEEGLYDLAQRYSQHGMYKGL